MKPISEILSPGRDPEKIISDLMTKSVSVPSWSTTLLDYEPSLHRIVNDKIERKDKVLDDGSIEVAARISIGMERLLTKRMGEFMFSIPIDRVFHNTDNNQTRQDVAKAIDAILKYARINSENIKRAEHFFAACEFCTVWYVVENPNTLYGFKSKYKLKCHTYSPMDGTELYPLFDEFGDMLAMSIRYKRKVQDTEITYFETYTSEKYFKWERSSGGWKEVKQSNIIIGKIPCVYSYRPKPIFEGLTKFREEIEYSLSRNSDVVAYNSAPILKASGLTEGDERRGEGRRIFEVDPGGDISYVSWNQSTQALEFQVNMMREMFWSLAQMPDVSFHNMSRLGNIGYDARQTLLTDAHLKVGDESGAWIETFEREISVIKAFLKKLNVSWEDEIDNVEVENIITPFIQNDDKAKAGVIMQLNGNKPVISQIEAIRLAGYSNDPEMTQRQIMMEQSAMQQQ